MTIRLKHWFRQIKRWPSWLFIPLLLLLRGYLLLMRKGMQDPQGYIQPGRFPWVTVTWHNHLLFFPLMFKPEILQRTVAMISASRDGQYLADLLRLLGLRSVRGSSSRRGAGALREAFEELARGNTVSITPDGPRGPRHRMSLGPVLLASRSGRPALPVAVNYSRYWQLRSWDRFRIPWPFSRITVVVGEPLAIPPDLDEAGLEHWRAVLEQRLNLLSEVKEGE